MEYEYRMVCSEHYFGRDCDTLCRPRDDQFGHYECDDEGRKVCRPGWQKEHPEKTGQENYCTKRKWRNIQVIIVIISPGAPFSPAGHR